MRVSDLLSLPELEMVYLPESVRHEEIHDVMVTELMSDVLTRDLDNLLLVTSLCTDQAIRTADMVGALAVIITNGKTLVPSMLAIAEESEIALFTTRMRNFKMCRLLCQERLSPPDRER